MAKQESTAINDLIHLVQGRIIDGSDDAQDDLFVTAQPQAMSAPLPRRRAPNATPPLVAVHDYDYDDDEVATTVDPHAVGGDPRWAIGSAPNPRPSAPIVAPWPQPILPQYARPTPAAHSPAPQYVLPTPAPLPPAPYHADCDATERVERYDDLPPQTWTARPALPRTTGPFEEHLDTVRVPALPPPPDAYVEEAPPSELVVMMKKCALPFAGLAIAMMFVGGYVLHSGQGGHKRDVPVVMAVTAAPIVTPIESAADAAPATWKPTAVQPTIAPASAPEPAQASEPASASASEPASASASASASEPEIEMEPATVTRPRKHRAKKSSSSAPTRVVARVARPEPKSVAAPRGRKADPIALALAAPTKSSKAAAKGTGPGTVTITSTPPALIYVDGRSTNQMTPKTLTLAPGIHKITLLEVSSRKAKTAEVDVAPGGSAQIAKKF